MELSILELCDVEHDLFFKLNSFGVKLLRAEKCNSREIDRRDCYPKWRFA
jgi:hypothetical protein